MRPVISWSRPQSVTGTREAQMNVVAVSSFAAGAAVAGACWLGSAPWALAATRLGHTSPLAIPRGTWWFAGGLVWLVVAYLFGAPRAVLAAGVGVVALAAWVRRNRSNVRKLRGTGREDCVEIVENLAADLRSGALPHVAIERLAHEFEQLVQVHAAMRNGADVAEAGKRSASQPGCESLAWVGAAWAVATESGAPLANVLDSLAAEVRKESDLLRDVETAVAPARSTALLMAVLPVFALGMGTGMGASPSEVITQSIWGAGSVTPGILLAVIGVFWGVCIPEGAERQ